MKIIVLILIFTLLIINTGNVFAENIELPAILGDKDAPITIVEVGSYAEQFSKRFVKETENGIRNPYVKYNLVNFKWYDNNLLFIDGYSGSLAALCAQEEKQYWNYHDWLFYHFENNQGKYITTELLDEIAIELNLNMTSWGKCINENRYEYESSIQFFLNNEEINEVPSGIPTFYIINSTNTVKLSGAQPYEIFVQTIHSMFSYNPFIILDIFTDKLEYVRGEPISVIRTITNGTIGGGFIVHLINPDGEYWAPVQGWIETKNSTTNMGPWDSAHDIFEKNGIYTLEFMHDGVITTSEFTIFGNTLPPETLYCGEPMSFYPTIINGTDGNDVLIGKRGTQLILGFGGDDFLQGNNGADCLIGGDGIDIFKSEEISDTKDKIESDGNDYCIDMRLKTINRC